MKGLKKKVNNFHKRYKGEDLGAYKIEQGESIGTCVREYVTSVCLYDGTPVLWVKQTKFYYSKNETSIDIRNKQLTKKLLKLWQISLKHKESTKS